VLPGTTTDLVKRLFSRSEAFDAEGFITFFTDDPVYQFGNFDICFDKGAIKQSADNFFSQINAVYHEIKMMWEVGDVVFVEMDVHYWRKDNSFVSLPCCDIFRIEGDKFSELRIFMDVNPVFDPSIPVPETASIFIESQGKRLTPPEVMKHQFNTHPEGVQRVQTGYAPKWNSSGPQWVLNTQPPDSLSSEPSMSQQLEALTKMSELILQEEWDEVKNYLTDDIMYKVGSGEPRYGKESVVNFLSYLFENVAKLDGHNVRKVWDEPGIISIEMDALYTRLKDSKKLTIACCDIYRMRGNQVSEWRVYADMAPFQED